MKIYTDKPIRSKNEDTLNRSRFSDMIADYLLSNITRDGFVISINGPWGCGKTSIINMVKQVLKDHVASKDNLTLPVFIDYSPWNATDQSQIIKQFLNVVSESFKESRVLRVIGKSLNVISSIAELSPLPSNIKSIIKGIDSAFANYRKAIENSKQDLDTFKDKVIEKLEKSYVRYIVFVDDIDRLNNEEIKLLIQLIKSVCNFPNVTYVLSYDKDIVAGALNGSQKDVDGYKYLEKIVQMEFNVPNIKGTRMKEITVRDLVELIDGCTEKDLQNIKTYVSLGLFTQLSNIREEKRYINSLSFALQCHKEEIDIADLCAITYLRNLDENIFKLIIEYRDYLLDKGHAADNAALDAIKKTFEDKLSHTKYRIDKSKFLLSHIFPNMFNANRTFAPARLDTKRLCNKKKFNRYLQFELDDNDIPAERLDAVLELKEVQPLLDLVHDLTGEQLNTFFISLESLSSDLVDIDKFKVVSLFAFNYMATIEHNVGDYEFLKERVIRIICINMIQNIGINKAQTVLSEVVPQTDDCLSLISLYTLMTDGASYGGIISSFDDSFKNTVLIKAKSIINKVLKESKTFPFSDAFGVVRFLVNNCKNELVEALKEKDTAWICKFMSSTIYRGYKSSGKVEYSYIYDKELLTLISASGVKINELKDHAETDRDKQRLIAIEMQYKEIVPKNNTCYFCEDIKKYCVDNNIDFIPSDMHEE